MEIKIEKIERPKPLLEGVYYYDHDMSTKPDRIRVSFEDGSTEIYELRTEQPSPVIVKNIEIIRKWKIGYQAPKRRRSRR